MLIRCLGAAMLLMLSVISMEALTSQHGNQLQVAVLLGGWQNLSPIFIRSDGRNCHQQRSATPNSKVPLFPQGPFVEAAAGLIENEGILLCGGLIGSPHLFTGHDKCYFMDFKRSKKNRLNERFIEMNDMSRVGGPLQPAARNAGPMSMVVWNAKTVYLYAEKSGAIFQGTVSEDASCDWRLWPHVSCSRIQVTWANLTHHTQRFEGLTKFGCLVLFQGGLYILGGKNANKKAINTAFRISRLSGKAMLDTKLTLPFEPRSRMACANFGGFLYVAGGMGLKNGTLQAMNDVYRIKEYSTAASWHPVQSMNFSRAFWSLVPLKTSNESSSSVLLAVGGISTDAESSPISVVEIYSGGNWSSGEEGSYPAQMTRFTAVAAPSSVSPECHCLPDRSNNRCIPLDQPGSAALPQYFYAMAICFGMLFTGVYRIVR